MVLGLRLCLFLTGFMIHEASARAIGFAAATGAVTTSTPCYQCFLLDRPVCIMLNTHYKPVDFTDAKLKPVCTTAGTAESCSAGLKT